MQTAMARVFEWDNTAYVPMIKVNIIAITEKMLSTIDAKFSFDTWRGSSYKDEMKQRNKVVVDSAIAIELWHQITTGATAVTVQLAFPTRVQSFLGSSQHR